MSHPFDPGSLPNEPSHRSARMPARWALALAAWFGIVAGAVDLAALLVKTRWFEPGYLNMSRHYPWMFPVSGLLISGSLGLALCLLSWVRPRWATWRFAVALLSAVVYLSFLFRWPIYTWACLLLGLGLAYQTGRLVEPRIRNLLPWLRASLAGLVVLVGGLVAFSYGREWWAEHQVAGPVHTAPAGAPNIVLVVLDTVRAGSLSLYGYARATSPNLERLAQRGVRFERALAPAPWTSPSHASLFTGRWCHELSVNWTTPLDRTYPTLAEYLGQRGYATGGFVANTYYCSYESGLDRGFAHYEDYEVTPRSILLCSSIVQRVLMIARNRVSHWVAFDDPKQASTSRKSAAAINRAALAWAKQQRSRPFFLFLNYYDAHHPYLPADPDGRHFGLRPESRDDLRLLRSWWNKDKSRLSPRQKTLVRDAYDDCIASLDHQLGVLFEQLETNGLLQNTLVIVTADHGEHLGEKNLFCHGVSLYQPELHVPLVLFGNLTRTGAQIPGGETVADPVSLRDVPATVVALAGLAGESPFPGASLARFWSSAGPAGGREAGSGPVLSEIETAPGFDPNRGRSPACHGPMQSLVSGSLHYIRHANGVEEIYNLDADPGEAQNLAGAASIRPALEQFRTALAETRSSPRSDLRLTGRARPGAAR